VLPPGDFRSGSAQVQSTPWLNGIALLVLAVMVGMRGRYGAY